MPTQAEIEARVTEWAFGYKMPTQAEIEAAELAYDMVMFDRTWKPHANITTTDAIRAALKAAARVRKEQANADAS